MADVSQIQLESVIYDIKDAAARNELATLENEIIISDTQPTAQNNKLWVKESSSSDGVSIPTMTDIGAIENTLNRVEDAIAYVQNGDTASRTYLANAFVYLRNHATLAEGLYSVNSGGIPSRTSVTGHLKAITRGSLNELLWSDTEPKANESRILLNGLKFIKERSDYGSGWVLDLQGEDSAGNLARVGFDKTGGVYCYYGGALQWQLLPIKTGTVTGESGVTTSHVSLKQCINVVTINGYLEATLTSGNQKLFTISGVSLPSEPVRAVCSVASAAYNHPDDVAYCTISSSGEFFVNTTASGSKSVCFSLSYIP